MSTYRVRTTLSDDGTLTLKGVPFAAGDKVEVTIRVFQSDAGAAERYPLRGKPIRYSDPYSAVAENEWEAMS